MELPKLDLDALRKISFAKKLALLAVLVAGISMLFYYYIVTPKFDVITGLQENIGKLDAEILATSIKVQHLDELVAANKELEKDLAANGVRRIATAGRPVHRSRRHGSRGVPRGGGPRAA